MRLEYGNLSGLDLELAECQATLENNSLEHDEELDLQVYRDWLEAEKALLEKLIPAAEAYYNSGTELMNNKEYDALYNELQDLEKKTGYICEESPTQRVGAIVVDELPKATHEYPALSLDKTKDIDEYVGKFEKHIDEAATKGFNNDAVVLMWKMDGSTVQATYEDGALVQLVTRGNGEIGSVITHNAPYVQGLPMKIDYKGKLVVRGEAVMSYDEFNRINETLSEEEQYKNPRNLANATISLLDSREMRQREICFKAFNLVFIDDGKERTFEEQLNLLRLYMFGTVKSYRVPVSKLKKEMLSWEKMVEDYKFPVDGLVCVMDNQAYTKDLQGTGHHPHIMNGFAFKWADETVETTIRKIFWSPSRTGLFNPVAVFDPVELCGTTVERASLHNLSYIFEKDIKVGDRVTVYKANMIIPQIDENLDAGCLAEGEDDWTRFSIPKTCPICGGALTISTDGNTGTTVLRCYNDNCGAKQIGSLVHFCERDCMDIRGMSEETITKLVKTGCISEYADFYKLEAHGEIANFSGFGQKSWVNMMEAAKRSAQDVGFVQFIHALGIPNIGKGQAKLLYKFYKRYDTADIINAPISRGSVATEQGYVEMLITDASAGFDFSIIDGIGPVMSLALHEWAHSPETLQRVFNVLKHLSFKLLPDPAAFQNSSENSTSTGSAENISGKTFVITGKLETFKNRDELVAQIEALGGTVAGSVSKNTDYLINNDVTSTSGKNKKAKELGIPIISEADYLKLTQ